jgi:hypothetical protein
MERIKNDPDLQHLVKNDIPKWIDKRIQPFLWQTVGAALSLANAILLMNYYIYICI